jgi:hypothetical protein
MGILAPATLYTALALAASKELWCAQRWRLRRAVWLHSLLITLIGLAVALYLGYWGKWVVRT